MGNGFSGLKSFLQPTTITSSNKSLDVGSKYQSLADANPYKGLTYQKTGFQKLLSALGFRTQADAWKENMQVQANEYDAALKQQEFSDLYNSPLEESSRMREAGLNPDLQGIGDVAESAGMGEDPSTPMQTTGDEQLLMSVANGVLNAFTTAVGVVGSIQNIATTGLGNMMKVEELAASQFDKFIPFLGESQDYSRSEVIEDSMQMARMFAKQNLPRRYRNRFANTIRGFWASAPSDAKAYEEWSKRISNRRGYSINSQSMYDEFSEVLYPMAKELAEMQEDIFRTGQQRELTDNTATIAENENRQEYASNLDAEVQALSENAGNEVEYENKQMISIMRSHLSKIVNDLEDTSKEGGIKGALAGVSMTLISMLQLWISSQGAPSISRSSSFSQGPKGSQSKSSFSLNL